MPYDVRVQIGGNVGWLRMAGKRPRACRCGAPATRLCDWKIVGEYEVQRVPGQHPKQATCDEPLCDCCTSSPAPGKDLCPTHAAQWKARTEAPA